MMPVPPVLIRSWIGRALLTSSKKMLLTAHEATLLTLSKIQAKPPCVQLCRNQFALPACVSYGQASVLLGSCTTAV